MCCNPLLKITYKTRIFANNRVFDLSKPWTCVIQTYHSSLKYQINLLHHKERFYEKSLKNGTARSQLSLIYLEPQNTVSHRCVYGKFIINFYRKILTILTLVFNGVVLHFIEFPGYCLEISYGYSLVKK